MVKYRKVKVEKKRLILTYWEWFALFIILSVGIIFLFLGINGYLKPAPSYNITENVCNNEDILTERERLLCGGIVNNTYDCEIIVGTYMSPHEQKQVCEKKEVDRLYQPIKDENGKILILDGAVILSKDLTKEWLDNPENCECIKVKTKKGYESHDKELIKDQYYGIKEKYGYSDWFCSTYSCIGGRYEVNVR